MKILAFAASLRRESLNKKLLRLAIDIAREAGAEVDHADFAEFAMPIYDGDMQDTEGFPPGAQALAERIRAADGIIISSPEYNFSMAGTLKNAIDWVSRFRPVPLQRKTGLLMAASTSMVGGIRGLWQLRVPLEGCGMALHPDMFALAAAQNAFAEDGSLKDQALAGRLHSMVHSYIAFGGALAGTTW
ncbi:MAG TPA: NAD(P)H-dependent oxidoreductase [Candidatus Kapabacteria bacterium]|nr:NAD(P)H-dependent oxidoreductase [Candidatus Kapabacteria bacterium]